MPPQLCQSLSYHWSAGTLAVISSIPRGVICEPLCSALSFTVMMMTFTEDMLLANIIKRHQFTAEIAAVKKWTATHTHSRSHCASLSGVSTDKCQVLCGIIDMTHRLCSLHFHLQREPTVRQKMIYVWNPQISHFKLDSLIERYATVSP